MRRKKKIDFFISYTKTNVLWAKWVDSCLKRAGYSTYSQFADFSAGQNIINQIHTALKTSDRVLGILSPEYLQSKYAAVEWMTALHDDPLGEQRRLIFVRIAECELTGLLPNMSYIDLVGLSETVAEEKLLSEIRRTLQPSLNAQSPTSRFTRPVFPPRLPQVWHLPVLRKSLFVGRDDLIAKIEESFASSNPTAVALTGMGGIGKTSIAVEYCYRQIDKYPVVWWIDASAERLIHQAVGQLAKELSYCDHPEDLTSHEVLELFERSHQKWPSLLVLDNVLTPEIALSSVPRSPDFHLLITSRNPLWLGTAQMIEVLPLQQETSIDFLIARSGDNDRTAATELCKQLGNLPIALEQAGRYIERTACGIKHYSTEFEERRRRAEKFDDESERAIAAVWSLSMRRLLYENPFASTVLRALSYWGPHRIPREFLLLDAMQLPLAMRILSSTLLRAMRFMARWVKGLEDLDESFDVDIFDLNRTLESLRRYGLLEVNPDDVCLHPLVRSVVRCQIAVLQRPFIIRVSVLLLKSSLTKVRRVDEKSKLWCLHVVDIGQSVEEELITQKDLVPLLIQAAQLTAAGSEEKKEIITETLERALRCCTALREKKRNNWDITCLLQLAAHSRDNDEYKKAAEYLCQAIDRLDEIKDRVSLLPEVMSEYAEILLSEYETHYAGRFCEAAMAIERKRTNGSPTLIRLLAEYSEILRVAGEYDAAEAAALEGLALAQTVSRENTFEVARLKFLIGKIQSCKGDSETARRHLEVAFSSIEQDFGAESPYLKSIGSELEFLNNLELRQAAAQIFQTPRTDESESWAKEVQSFSVREPFVDAYELACEAAFEHLQHIAMPALIRAGLADARSEDLSLYPALEASVASKAELGKVLSSVIVPIYKAIADDPLWTEGGQLFDIFREEILTQYSVSFRMRMFWHLPTDGNWGEFLDTSPSFEDYISLFENNVSNFFEMVPECLISFEKDLLAGELSGCRAGVYGATLRFDAGFYLNRFLRYADLDGSA